MSIQNKSECGDESIKPFSRMIIKIAATIIGIYGLFSIITCFILFFVFPSTNSETIDMTLFALSFPIGIGIYQLISSILVIKYLSAKSVRHLVASVVISLFLYASSFLWHINDLSRTNHKFIKHSILLIIIFLLFVILYRITTYFIIKYCKLR